MADILKFTPPPRPLDRLWATATNGVRKWLRTRGKGKSRVSAMSPVGKLLAAREARKAIRNEAWQKLADKA